MTSFRVQSLKNFKYSHPEDWLKWSWWFKGLCQGLGLVKEEDEGQINTIIYAMGSQASDIPSSSKLSSTQLKQYRTAKMTFDKHFIVCRNVLFKGVELWRWQEEGETVYIFFKALHTMAEHCTFWTLQEELIGDQIWLLVWLPLNSLKNLNLTPSLLWRRRCTRPDKAKPWRDSKSWWKRWWMVDAKMDTVNCRKLPKSKEFKNQNWWVRKQDYLIGFHFHIKMDHKPLVPLLSTKNLNELPAIVQCF